MALDEPQAQDQRYEIDGLAFVVRTAEAQVISQIGKVHVDYINNAIGRGFLVTSRTPYPSGC